MKLWFVVITTLCLFSEIHPALSHNVSSGSLFSSLLKTKVKNPITEPFRINGPNGYCAHTSGWVYLQLYDCGAVDQAQRFTFHDDGTLRVNSKCLTARGFTQGSKAEPDNCNNPNKRAITWQVETTDRQISHPASGLVLSAILGKKLGTFTLEENLFSSYQTFRLDYDPPKPNAHIMGMNHLCLLSKNNKVWLGACGSAGAQKWVIYPDGTFRPRERENGCLSFDNFASSRVLVMSCGLSPTTERWVLNEDGEILNERFDLALDVAGGDPSSKKIVVKQSNGEASQQWRIFYD